MDPKLATAHRRRGALVGSITRLDKRVKDLETLVEATDLSVKDRLTLQQLEQKLETFDTNFKTYHFEALELIEEKDQDDEQAMLDEHEDRIADITTRIHLL